MSMTSSNVTSGFIDLATYDELEKYMYGGDDATAYFVRETRKSTWFTQVPVVLSRASGTPSFDSEWSVQISRAGDYLLNTWLRVTLPSLTPTQVSQRSLSATVTFNTSGVATPVFIALAGNTLQNGTIVQIVTGSGTGTIPTFVPANALAVSSAYFYYVVGSTSSGFNISTTLNGSAITYTSSASYTLSITSVDTTTITISSVTTPGTYSNSTLPLLYVANGLAIQLTGTPSASYPVGYTSGTVYYTVNSTGSTFGLSLSPGGTQIASTSTGGGGGSTTGLVFSLLQTTVCWTRNLMHNLINEASITFNDLVAARFDNYHLDFWSAFTVPASKREGYDAMIGNNGLLTTMMPSQAETVLNLPLPFFFSRDSGVALPTAAIPYNDMRINFSFRDYTELVLIDTPVSVPRRAVASDFSSVPTLQNTQVWANYAIVSNDERKRMACAPRDILIEQVQTAPKTVLSSSNLFPSYDIRFSQAVKVLFCALRNTTGKLTH